MRREVVAARLAQQELGVGVGPRQGLEGLEVRAHVLADRRVRAAPRLDGGDAVRRQRRVPRQELGVLAREDVVRHDGQAVLLPQRPAELQRQRRLAAADGAADAHRERAPPPVAAPPVRRQARLAPAKLAWGVEVLMSVAVRPAPGPQLCAGHAAAPGKHFF